MGYTEAIAERIMDVQAAADDMRAKRAALLKDGVNATAIDLTIGSLEKRVENLRAETEDN